MDNEEIRLECLRLACMQDSARTATDQNRNVIELAEQMLEFVTKKD